MNKRIIVALDLSNLHKAEKIVNNLKKEVFAFKIGHEFFYNFGINGYKKIYVILYYTFDWKLFKLGSVSVRNIRKNVPILQVGGSSLVPPTPPVSKLVLFHKKAFV